MSEPEPRPRRYLGCVWAVVGACVLVVAICGCGYLFVLTKFVPVKLQNSELEDCILRECRRYSPGGTLQPVQDNIWRCAESLQLDRFFAEGDIVIREHDGEIEVRIYYVRPVPVTSGFTYDWKFDVIVDAKGIHSRR